MITGDSKLPEDCNLLVKSSLNICGKMDIVMDSITLKVVAFTIELLTRNVLFLLFRKLFSIS